MLKRTLVGVTFKVIFAFLSHNVLDFVYNLSLLKYGFLFLDRLWWYRWLRLNNNRVDRDGRRVNERASIHLFLAASPVIACLDLVRLRLVDDWIRGYYSWHKWLGWLI